MRKGKRRRRRSSRRRRETVMLNDEHRKNNDWKCFRGMICSHQGMNVFVEEKRKMTREKEEKKKESRQ
jgi:hypothetical protein